MSRDEQMLEWFSIVRVSNVETIRWVLGALNGWDVPVSVRRAQGWCARMEQAGMVGRARIGSTGGSVVWATFAGVGRTKPDVYRQTTRHEIAVSTASARFAAAGYAWRRDERAQQSGEHQADGIALGVEWVELIEVELTAKRPARYVEIFRAYRERLKEVDQVTYLCTPEAGRAVRAALAASREGLLISRRVTVQDVYDRGGLLSAMYVDKQLSGVNAVQTLSRLNRTATGKDWTSIVDFVNDPAVIVESFEPYYRDAKLSEVSDPNIVHDIRMKLDTASIYEPSEIETAARAVVLGELKGKPTTGNSALSSAIEPGRQRFHVRFDEAVEKGDEEARDRLELFRADLRSYVSAYDFLSQIVDYADPDVEKFAIYARALSAVLKRPAAEAAVDLSGVELLKYAISPQDARALAIEGGMELDPPKQGTGGTYDPVLASLREAVEALNQLWDGDFTTADAMGVVTWVSGKASEDSKLSAQALVNSEQQFLASPDLKPKVVDALLDSQANLAGMGKELFESEQKLAAFIEVIGKVIWDQSQRAA